MTPTLAATLNGALATTLVLLGLICAVWIAVWIAVDWLRTRRDDRRMRRGFRAARRYGLINNGDER